MIIIWRNCLRQFPDCNKKKTKELLKNAVWFRRYSQYDVIKNNNRVLFLFLRYVCTYRFGTYFNCFQAECVIISFNRNKISKILLKVPVNTVF